MKIAIVLSALAVCLAAASGETTAQPLSGSVGAPVATLLADPAPEALDDTTTTAPASPPVRQAGTQGRAGRGTPRPRGGAPVLRLRLSGHAGFTSFTASDTFQAVLDTSSGPEFGGGVGVLIGRHLFAEVQVARFSADGERVFVTDDLRVFPLGIPTTVTTTPVDISVGWRFTPRVQAAGVGPRGARRGFRPVPFVGGGVGRFLYRETAEFAESGDDVSEAFGSYHVLGGVELPFTARFGASIDGVYRWVPDAIGEAGVSAVYGDTDLGGITVRVKATVTF